MNTIEDLRTTLAAHADRLGDSPTLRSARVRARARRARARRVGGVAAVVAVLVAAAGLASLMPDVDRPPVAALPEEVTALPFTYELSDTEVLEVSADRRQIQVPTPHDRGRWAVAVRGADLGTGTATVFVNAEPVLRIKGDERSALYPIPFHAGGQVTVKVADDVDAGKVTLGIYEQSAAVAGDTLSHAGRLFPATYGGAGLVGGEFGDPDDTVVHYSFRARGRPVVLAPVCQDPAGAFEVRYEVDGEEVGRGDCGEDTFAMPTPDLAARNTLQPDQVSPGRRTVTLRAARKDGSAEPPEGAPMLMGIAVYEVGEQRDLGQTKIDEIAEQHGRRWRVDRVIPISKTDAFSTKVVTGDRPALIGFEACGRTVTAHARSESVGRRTDGATSTDSTPGCGYTVGDQLLAYDTYDVVLEPVEAHGTFEGALVVYRPVD